jgi:hypothetical protein
MENETSFPIEKIQSVVIETNTRKRTSTKFQKPNFKPENPKSPFIFRRGTVNQPKLMSQQSSFQKAILERNQKESEFDSFLNQSTEIDFHPDNIDQNSNHEMEEQTYLHKNLINVFVSPIEGQKPSLLLSPNNPTNHPISLPSKFNSQVPMKKVLIQMKSLISQIF